MVWRVEIAETGERQLGKLCKRNPGVAARLLKKLDEAGVLANPRSTGVDPSPARCPAFARWGERRNTPPLRGKAKIDTRQRQP